MHLVRSIHTEALAFGWAAKSRILSQIRKHAGPDVRRQVGLGTLGSGPSEDSVTLTQRLVRDQINYPENYID